MWEINNSLQVISFIRSVVFGFIICVLYDITRNITVSFKFSNLSVFIFDVLFFIFLLPFIFCFLLSTTNGELRGYIFIGILSGFFICRISFSRIFNPILRKILSLLSLFFVFLNHKISAFCELNLSLLIKISKKARFLCKKCLKQLKNS